jgi:hypothetical protein
LIAGQKYPVRLILSVRYPGTNYFKITAYTGSNLTPNLIRRDQGNFFEYKTTTSTKVPVYGDVTVTSSKEVPIDPTPTRMVTKYRDVTIPSKIDVTEKTKSLVSNNKLAINKGEYSVMLGNDPAPNYTKKYMVGYKLEQNLDNTSSQITNKEFLIDGSGQFVIKYNYNGVDNISVISTIEAVNLCPSNTTCNYTLVLEDDGSLSVYDNSKKRVWNKKYIQNANPNITENQKWKEDPQNRNYLSIGEKLSISSTINRLVSKNGLYKLCFMNENLVVRFSSIPYKTTTDNTNSLENAYYTTSQNRDNISQKQIYYLYRTDSNSMLGKKFLVKSNKINTNNNEIPIVSARILPNNFDQILAFDKFEKSNNIYPLLNESDLTTVLNASVPTELNSKRYKVDTTSPEFCEKNCQDDPNCSHYFYLNTQKGDRCILNMDSNSLALQSNMPPNNQITASYFKNKKSKIITTCGNNKSGEQIPIVPGGYGLLESQFQVYNNPLTNSSLDTYYCSDPIYKTNNQRIKEIYNPNNTNMREGFSIPESKVIINDISNNNRIYIQRQEQVGRNYIDVSNNITKNMNLYRTLESNDVINGIRYKDDEMKIPDMYSTDLNHGFEDTESTRPLTSVRDALKTDENIMLLQQNSLYITGTITAATLLIAAVLLAK